MRNHSGLLAGLALTLALAFFVNVPGCGVKTDSTTTPGKRVDAAQLQAEAIDRQAAFDRRAADITASVASYSAEVTAYNAKLTAAAEDLAHKAQQRQQLLNTVGGIARVAAGVADPSGTVGAAITLALAGVAGGSFLDSRKKAAVIDRLRQGADRPGSDEPAPAAPTAIAADDARQELRAAA